MLCHQLCGGTDTVRPICVEAGSPQPRLSLSKTCFGRPLGGLPLLPLAQTWPALRILSLPKPFHEDLTEFLWEFPALRAVLLRGLLSWTPKVRGRTRRSG